MIPLVLVFNRERHPIIYNQRLISWIDLLALIFVEGFASE
jgi:hypothetical protein